jgi:hypothetical protein
MKLEKGTPKQMIAAGVLGVVALAGCVYIYESLFASPAPSAPQPAAATTAARQAPALAHTAKEVTGPATSLDPSLHMQGMLASEAVEYLGVGRNIFSPNSAPPPDIPKPVVGVRVDSPPRPVPCPPNCPPPPPPPPIDLKYFGVEIAANGKRQACLLHEDTVYLASDGDVVLRRYKIISVDPKSIQVEDMQNNNKQTLPLLTN